MPTQHSVRGLAGLFSGMQRDSDILSGRRLQSALLTLQAYKSDAYWHPIALQEEWPEYAKFATGHGQFWVLIREHAEIVNADTFVERLFTRHCFTSISE